MAETASYVVKLKDLVSGPAKKSAKSLAALEKQMGLTRDASGRLRQSNGRFATGAQKAALGIKGQSGAMGDLKTVLKRAAIAWIAYKTAVFGAAVASRAIETERTVNMLDALTGKGKETFGEISGLANQLGLDVDEANKSYAGFLKQQFTPEAAKEMLKLGADLQALGGTAEETAGVFLALRQIKAVGTLQGDELNQLAERGVSVSLVYEEIARAMGVTLDQAKKLKEGGKVTADVAIGAIKRATNRALNQDALGQSAKRFVETTMAGAIAASKSKAKSLWITLTEAASPGIAKGMSAAVNAITQFAASKEGARVLEFFSDAMAKFGKFAELAFPLIADIGKELLGGFVQGFEGASDSMAQLFGPGGLASAEEWVGFLRTSIIPAARSVGDVIGKVASAIATVGKFMGIVFTGISMGIAGLSMLVSKAWELGKSIGRSVLDGIKSALGIASPSKELMKVGEWSGQGFEAGLGKSMPDDIAPTISSGGAIANGAARLATSSAGGGGSVSVGDVTIQVSGAGAPEEVAAATLSAFERNLGSIMTRYATEAAA